MYAKLMLCAVALFMACKVLAVQLTPQEALARMNSTQTQAKGVVSDDSSMQLVYTSTFKGNNTYYVFNKGNEDGFVILSADDSMPAVLADVEGASFDYDKIPENMKWWLSQYDYSIYSYATKGKKYVSAAAKKNIAPLLGGIAWDQGEPYNLKCPEYEGFNAVTGCVATAMAQIMRMHKWPKQGAGKCEYDCYFQYDYDHDNDTPLTKTITLSADLSKSTYQWDKMPETYFGLETMEQKLAVAQLMYDCGVASKMSYGFLGSGAYGFDAYRALIVNFNYDKNAKCLERYLYEDDEWETMVYENLSKGLPLYYDGAANNGTAHAFVCDGYKADGNLFHFNWGWGGFYDGYFLMSGKDSTAIINPTGEENSSYSTWQTAIFDLKPATEPYTGDDEFELVVSRPYGIYAWDESKQKDVKASKIDRSVKMFSVGGDNFFLQYPGFDTHDYAIGIKFKSETDAFVCTLLNDRFYPLTILYSWSVNVDDILKNGKYTVSYVYKDITAGNTEWKDAKYEPGIEKPVVEIVGTEPIIYVPEKIQVVYDGKVVGQNVAFNPNKKEFTVNMKVKALKDIGEQRLWMDVAMSDYGDMYVHERKPVVLPASKKGEVHDVSIRFSNNQLQPGVYCSICMLHDMGKGLVTIPSSNNNFLNFSFIDAPTGIETITQNVDKKATEAIYDIYGRKVDSMKKGGIYIVNGKKIIVK